MAAAYRYKNLGELRRKTLGFDRARRVWRQLGGVMSDMLHSYHESKLTLFVQMMNCMLAIWYIFYLIPNAIDSALEPNYHVLVVYGLPVIKLASISVLFIVSWVIGKFSGISFVTLFHLDRKPSVQVLLTFTALTLLVYRHLFVKAAKNIPEIWKYYGRKP